MNELAKATKQIDLFDWLHEDWKNLPGENTLFVCGYRIARANLEALGKQPVILDVNGVRAIIFDGTFPYWRFSEYKSDFFECTGMKVFAMPKEEKTESGPLLLIIAPYCLSGKQLSEGSVLDQLSSVKGIITAVLGNNAAAIKLFTNLYKVETKQIQLLGEAIVNPASMPLPNITDIGISELKQIVEQIDSLPKEMSNRVWLALHWYDLAWDGQREDSFLKLWIALEVLAMPSSTNIKNIKNELAKLYSKNAKDDEFKIGLLFRLRGEIVHNGLKAIIHAELFNYLDAIFIDLLYSICGSVAPKKVKQFLDRINVELEILIKSASGKN